MALIAMIGVGMYLSSPTGSAFAEEKIGVIVADVQGDFTQ